MIAKRCLEEVIGGDNTYTDGFSGVDDESWAKETAYAF
jgi:hypothetical protein